MTPDTLAALMHEAALLDELAHADLSNPLPLITHLRKTYSPELTSAAIETAQLRQRANAKFIHAAQMFFTADALEQATHQAVADYHAQLLSDYTRVVDLGCGIGGDVVLRKNPSLGIDHDPVRLRMARHNAGVYGAPADFIQADLTATLPLAHVEAAFFDPARRTDQRRVYSIKDYSPPLHLMDEWRPQAGLVKLSPGIKWDEMRPESIAFVSHHGDLKEALWHIGELRFDGLRAVNLSADETLIPQGLAPPPLTDAPLRYLYEPDPAVIRAGLLSELCHHLNITAYRLDETIAYLTGDAPITDNPWLRSWPIDEWLPFNLKKLRRALQARNIGKLTVKKRGSPITPEELPKLLKLKKGHRHATLILTRLQGQHVVLVSL